MTECTGRAGGQADTPRLAQPKGERCCAHSLRPLFKQSHARADLLSHRFVPSADEHHSNATTQCCRTAVGGELAQLLTQWTLVTSRLIFAAAMASASVQRALHASGKATS